MGITSWGVGCGENMIPGVYASIEESLCFIKWAVECKHGADYQGLIDTSGCEEYIDEELQSINIVIKKIEANIRR